MTAHHERACTMAIAAYEDALRSGRLDREPALVAGEMAKVCTVAENMPHVCPGCHAVGEEQCAPGCIDAEIAAEHEYAIATGDYDRTEYDE